ncbi:MAG: trypsin-like peptidase domain-containing protein [Kiritimatiellia bacterium]
MKLFVTIQRPDYFVPWQNNELFSGSGSGFIIDGKKILTNAHVVSDARFIQVQKQGDSRRYMATVTFAAHDCDLAVLSVRDDSFFDNTHPARFAGTMPGLNEEVTVIGYPRGGLRLSITKGVVSRMDYAIYSHSSRDHHLVLQVDAAINAGNSGGPVVFDDKVIGLAFQVLTHAENIGYAIPLPVLSRFLADIEDGTYHGYPELGAAFMNTRNPALRADMRLPSADGGVAVYYLDPFGSGTGVLKPGDVLMSVDGYPIASDGSIEFNNNRMLFAELLERKQIGDTVDFNVHRGEAQMDITVPLKTSRDPYAYRNIYDKQPEYYIFGGLVFSPLTRPYLRALNPDAGDRNEQQLIYYSEYAKLDGLYKGRDEFVVLTARLPHKVNAYADGFLNGIVSKVNNRPVRRLQDVKTAAENHNGPYHTVEFIGMEDMFVMDAGDARRAEAEILSDYGVPSPANFEDNQ